MSVTDDFRKLAEQADYSCDLNLWRAVVSLADRHPGILQEKGTRYIMGYALYNLVDTEPGAATRCEAFLKSALAGGPDDHYARLYLGHLAFDAGRYATALEYFDAVPRHAFARFDQHWRDLKRQELRICCLTHLGKTASLVEEFEQYLCLAVQCEESDAITAYELPRLMCDLAGQTT